MRNKALATFAALLLAGCGGPLVQIGGGGEPPGALLTLRSAAPPVSSARVDPGNTLTILAPIVPGTLQTLRLPVLTSETEVQYLKEANWVEQPSRLFQRLLADTLASRAGVTIVSDRQSDIAAARRLSGQLLEFGLDARDPSRPQVRVRFDATLTGRAGALHAQRRFETTQPVTAQTPSEVGAALNAAANTLAADVASWVSAT